MKIGLISDTHDDCANLRAALVILEAEGITTVLHCGDLCGPEIVRLMREFDVWIARGNMDHQMAVSQQVGRQWGVGRLAWFHRLVLDGYSLAVTHGNDGGLLNRLISSGEHAYVVHGHTHRRRDQRVGRTHVINPGALSRWRLSRPSFCILDLTTGDARFLEPSAASTARQA
jgi:putative phosphoesterase